MSIELMLFNFQSIFIRVILLGNTILFVASDVAKALGYKDAAQAVKQHCKYAKSLIDIDPLIKLVQQNQALKALDPKTKIIPESDFYRMSIKTRKSEAETLIDWVSETVIPTVRNRSKEIPIPLNIVTYNGIEFWLWPKG